MGDKRRPGAGGPDGAFDVGSSEEHINSINADGAAFAAIQGLSAELDARDARIGALETTVETQREELDEKAERIDELEAENEQLRERLSAVEDHLGLGGGDADTAAGVADD